MAVAAFSFLVVIEVLKKKSRTTPKKTLENCQHDWRRMKRPLRAGKMDEEKAKRLREAGWTIGSAYDFLEMTDEESSYVELKLVLSAAVRRLRHERHLTQAQLAKLMRSSQSRVAKAEAGDASVSLDLLIRSLLTMGASNRDLADLISASAHG